MMVYLSLTLFDVIKDSIRQASTQIAKLTIKLVTPDVLSENEAKKVHIYLALRQKDLKSLKRFSSHFEQTGLKLLDPIDPAQIKPNDNPFETHTEREPLLAEINNLLQVNSSIDMKNTYCNLPGTVIHLKTTPGSVAYQRQYALSEAYRSAVASDLDDLCNVSEITAVWSDKHEKAFTALKHALTNAPVISPPIICQRFHVATEASVTGIGAILYQVIADDVKFVALASRKLTVSESNYSTTKRELLAVVYAFEKIPQVVILNSFYAAYRS
jgi:hypothetical protein